MIFLTWKDLRPGASSLKQGESVEITGYLYPVESDDAEHAYFVLGPDMPCCRGCFPRDPSRAVEVFAASPVGNTGLPLRVTGTLRTLIDDPAGWRYQLTGARARPIGDKNAFARRRMFAAAGPLLCLAAGLPGTAAAAPAPIDDPLDEAAGRAAIEGAVTVDMHSHAGGLAGARPVEENVPFLKVAEKMRSGGMAVSCLAIVSDAPVHRIGPDRRIRPFRDPDPGELFAYGERCFQRVHALIAEQNFRVITAAADLHAASSDAPAAIVTAEGADFLEDRIERLDEAYERWQLRHLQLTHYRVNALGDIQTEAPVHGGLTDFGADVIRRCNARGIVVDVAHGTFDLVALAASVTTKPLILSHTSLSQHPTARSRLISPEHAKLIAGTGGVIGIWPPASRFPTMRDLARGFAAMVDVVGVDHVGLGSDMLGLTGPTIFRDYDATPALSAALLAQGFSVGQVRKLLGENYVRVFSQTLA